MYMPVSITGTNCGGPALIELDNYSLTENLNHHSPDLMHVASHLVFGVQVPVVLIFSSAVALSSGLSLRQLKHTTSRIQCPLRRCYCHETLTVCQPIGNSDPEALALGGAIT